MEQETSLERALALLPPALRAGGQALPPAVRRAAEDYCRASFEDDAPEPVRLAILLFVGFYYENRDLPDRTTYGTMHIAFQHLLYPYRDPEKMF